MAPYSNLSHSLFNPHLSSLVPSRIVQVESEKHGFKFKIYKKLNKLKKHNYEIEVLGCRDGIPRSHPLKKTISLTKISFHSRVCNIEDQKHQTHHPKYGFDRGDETLHDRTGGVVNAYSAFGALVPAVHRSEPG